MTAAKLAFQKRKRKLRREVAAWAASIGMTNEVQLFDHVNVAALRDEMRRLAPEIIALNRFLGIVKE